MAFVTASSQTPAHRKQPLFIHHSQPWHSPMRAASQACPAHQSPTQYQQAQVGSATGSGQYCTHQEWGGKAMKKDAGSIEDGLNSLTCAQGSLLRQTVARAISVAVTDTRRGPPFFRSKHQCCMATVPIRGTSSERGQSGFCLCLYRLLFFILGWEMTQK